MKQNSRLKALIILDNKLDVNIEMSHLNNGFNPTSAIYKVIIEL